MIYKQSHTYPTERGCVLRSRISRSNPAWNDALEWFKPFRLDDALRLTLRTQPRSAIYEMTCAIYP